MDPEYNYLEKIPQMHKYRKKSSMFSTAYTIEDNLTRTAGILITGEEDCPTNKRKKDLSVGNTGYYESGTCGEGSSPECEGKSRHILVNNLPFKQKGNKGLIPSIINDITTSFEPIGILSNMNGSGEFVNDKCSMQNISVVQLNPGGKMYKRDLKACVSDVTLPPVVKSVENFESQVLSGYNSNYRMLITICILTLFLSYKRYRWTF
jgi:hypothetical protein|uniref:Uncharacterized protein n=1 Tax=viral metagenome TaxID=1070528 RepID=A0A6C0AG51_9ZZZZ|tara:strand:+ start:2587 stop:3207 length:621 start_codon:yes stop_codon:yes gene_type:complete